MTRRSINVIQFWLKVAFFSIPAVAYSLAGYIRFRSGYFEKTEIDRHSYILLTLFVTLLWALVVQHLRLNRIETLITLQTGIRTAAIATVYCTVLALSGLFFYRNISFARMFVVAGCGLIFLLSLVVIHLFRGVIHAMRGLLNGRFSVAILGADDFAERVAQHIGHNQFTPCKVGCFVALTGQTATAAAAPVLEWDRLDDVVERFRCKEILVALPLHRFSEAQKLLERVQHLCIPVRLVMDIGEGTFVPDRIFDFYGLPLLDVRTYAIDTVGYAVGKRIFDIVFSLVILIIAAPLISLIALAIKLSSSGPVFFKQERISLNGKCFEMLKFRTMCVQDKESCNTQHTKLGDPRITSLGRFLRRTSLDEIPQFVNVLRGEMSVVGPRPELTFFVKKFRSEIPVYMSRHNVKCGITGWAQVNGLRGSSTSISKRIQCDLYYLRNWSMALDLKIIILTVFNGLLARNAY